MEFDFNDLNNLDVENIGEWPAVVRWAVIAIVCAVVVFIGYNLHIENKLEQLESIAQQENSLKQQVKGTAFRLAKEQATREELTQMKQMFGRILQQLPKEFHIAQLLESISKVGQENSLKFRLLKPSNVQSHEFYAVIPIRVVAEGDYHQLAKFVSDLANLKQPLRFTDLTIEQGTKKVPLDNSHGHKKVKDHELLILKLSAEVYRNNSGVVA